MGFSNNFKQEQMCWSIVKYVSLSRATAAEAFVTIVDPIFLEFVGGCVKLAACLLISHNFAVYRSYSCNSSDRIVLLDFVR